MTNQPTDRRTEKRLIVSRITQLKKNQLLNIFQTVPWFLVSFLNQADQRDENAMVTDELEDGKIETEGSAETNPIGQYVLTESICV